MTRPSILHVLIGPVGAGKTTLGQRRAIAEDALFLDVDSWMVRLFGADARPAENVIGWYLERRERVRSLLWDVALDVLCTGTDVWLEFGLVTAAERAEFYARAQAAELTIAVYLIDAPRDLRRERVLARNHAAGPATKSCLWNSSSEHPTCGKRPRKRNAVRSGSSTLRAEFASRA